LSRIGLGFGAPRHGWLPVRLDFESRSIEFEASDVPNNPVQRLVDALEAATQHRPSEVWWHLEPDGYIFRFLPSAGKVELQVSYAKHSVHEREVEVASIIGSAQEILLPIWRALRELQAHGLAEPAWPPVDFSRLPILREALRGES
jgi:hypothetical protein